MDAVARNRLYWKCRRGLLELGAARDDALRARYGIAPADLTLVNLRGVKESGVIFAVPSYFFIVSMEPEVSMMHKTTALDSRRKSLTEWW